MGQEWINRAARYAPGLTEAAVLGYVLGIPLGQALALPVRDGLLLTIVLGMLLSRIPGGRRHPPAPPPVILTLFALFALSALVSAVGSFYPALSLSRAAYAPIAFLLFIAVQDVETSPGAFRRMFIVLSAVVWLLGLDGVYQYATGHSLFGGYAMYKGRVAGSLPHPNDLALIPILLPIALGLLARERALAVRLFVLSSLPLAVLTTVLSQSRNAWLGLALGLGFFIIVGRHRRVSVSLAAFAGAFFVVAYVFDLANIANRARVFFGGPGEHRTSLWLVAWEMFKESPLLGKGTHTFGEFYHPYLSRVALPGGVIPELGPVPWAHNLILELLAERGLLGLVTFLALTLAMIVLLFRSWRAPVAFEAAPDTRTFALGLAGSLFVFLAMGQLDLTFLKDWVLLVYTLLAALIARLPELQPRHPVASSRGVLEPDASA